MFLGAGSAHWEPAPAISSWSRQSATRISPLWLTAAVAFGKDRFLVTYTYFSASYDIYGRFGIPNPGMFIPMVRR